MLISAHATRRKFLQHVATSGVCLAYGLRPALALASTPVFAGKTLAQVAKALGAKSVAPSADVHLNTLDYAENGAAVPVDIATSLPGVERIVLFVEKNPTPLMAVFQPGDAMDGNLTLHTKMAQTSAVYAMVIMADGRALYAKKEVKVVLGSCGSVSETPDNVDAKRPTEPTRIRAQIQGDVASVRMRMAHEMESGQRKDKDAMADRILRKAILRVEEDYANDQEVENAQSEAAGFPRRDAGRLVGGVDRVRFRREREVDDSLCQRQFPLGAAKTFIGLPALQADLLRLRVGKTDVFHRHARDAAGQKARVFAAFQHAGEPVKRRVGI